MLSSFLRSDKSFSGNKKVVKTQLFLRVDTPKAVSNAHNDSGKG